MDKLYGYYDCYDYYGQAVKRCMATGDVRKWLVTKRTETFYTHLCEQVPHELRVNGGGPAGERRVVQWDGCGLGLRRRAASDDGWLVRQRRFSTGNRRPFRAQKIYGAYLRVDTATDDGAGTGGQQYCIWDAESRSARQ